MSAPRHLTFHYTLRDAQGRVLDTSRGASPLACVEGVGQIIEGLEAALREMAPGEKRLVAVPPERAYGPKDPMLIQKVKRSQIPADDLRVGDRFQTGPERDAPIVTVVGIEGDEVTLDANHPMVGLELHFDVELIAARPATPAELQAGTEHP